jgi:hypothetical protein
VFTAERDRSGEGYRSLDETRDQRLELAKLWEVCMWLEREKERKSEGISELRAPFGFLEEE